MTQLPPIVPVRQTVHFPNTFAVNSVPTDPTTVLFSWEQIKPLSAADPPVAPKTVTTWTGGPGGSSSGGPPNIVRDGIGVYHVDQMPTTTGPFRWRWEGTGVCQAVNEGEFRAGPSPLA